MIDLAGLPAVSGATMLGLRLVTTFDCFSWSNMKPTTKKVAPAKASSSLTTSSPSATSSVPSKPLLWEPLDACIQRDGVMDPFHCLFGKDLFDVGLANLQSQDISTSIESSQIPALSHGTTSHLGPHHSGGLLAQVPSCITSPPHIKDAVEVTPFRALFPVSLLLEQFEPATQAKSNDLTASAAPPACSLELSTLIYDGQISLDEMLSDKFTSIEAEYPDLLSEHASHEAGSSGRTSQLSGAGVAEGFGSLSGSLGSSRRSSWATTISASLIAVDDDNSSLRSEKLESAVDLEQNEDVTELELLHEYEHYSDLIDVGHPDNCRKRDFIAPAPGAEGGINMVTAEEDTQASDEPTPKTKGDTVTVTACPEALATQVTTYQPEEQDMGMTTTEMESSHAAHKPATDAHTGYIVPNCPKALTIQNGPEHAGEPAQPEISPGAYSQLQPPRGPAEEMAWAHSHCHEAHPESPRIRLLKDQRGREYILYFDCFHILPIEMALAGEPAQPEISPGSCLQQQQPPRRPAEEMAWAHSHCHQADPENPRLRLLEDQRGREYILYFDCFHVLPIEMARLRLPQPCENDDAKLDVPQQLGTTPEERDNG